MMQNYDYFYTGVVVSKLQCKQKQQESSPATGKITNVVQSDTNSLNSLNVTVQRTSIKLSTNSRPTCFYKFLNNNTLTIKKSCLHFDCSNNDRLHWFLKPHFLVMGNFDDPFRSSDTSSKDDKQSTNCHYQEWFY